MICRNCCEEFIPIHKLARFCPECKKINAPQHLWQLYNHKVMYHQKYREQNNKYMRDWKKDNACNKNVMKSHKYHKDQVLTKIHPVNHGHRYTDAEIDFIIQNRDSMTAVDIALALGRSYSAILGVSHRNEIQLINNNKRLNKVISKEYQHTH